MIEYHNVKKHTETVEFYLLQIDLLFTDPYFYNSKQFHRYIQYNIGGVHNSASIYGMYE